SQTRTAVCQLRAPAKALTNSCRLSQSSRAAARMAKPERARKGRVQRKARPGASRANSRSGSQSGMREASGLWRLRAGGGAGGGGGGGGGDRHGRGVGPGRGRRRRRGRIREEVPLAGQAEELLQVLGRQRLAEGALEGGADGRRGLPVVELHQQERLLLAELE